MEELKEHHMRINDTGIQKLQCSLGPLIFLVLFLITFTFLIIVQVLDFISNFIINHEYPPLDGAPS